MLDLDIGQFWKDDALAHQDNCFSKQAPQVAMGIGMSEECVFAELGEEGQPWGHTPIERRMDLNKRYNEKALMTVGRKLLREDFPDPKATFPGTKNIGTVFAGQYVFDGQTTWLKRTITTIKELEDRLDYIDKLDFRSFILPENWDSEKQRIFETYGKRPGQFKGIRGPVTLASSVFGTENLIYLILDEPELATRFSNTIADVILKYIDLFIEESGRTQDDFSHGFSFNDDDCCLMTPDMYKLFGYPILKRIFDKVSPLPQDYRYQHSDSAMGHLIPLLSDFNLTGCNFGPTVTVREIREHMKNTRIDGQLAPFTFMNNNEEQIIKEVKRDCAMARENDSRGLNLTTAGSINNGSLLTSMRTVMAAIQNYGRY